MKSNYERNKFNLIYLTVSIVMVLVTVLVIGFFFRFNTVTYLVVGIETITVVVLYFVCKSFIDKAYDTIDYVSDAMGELINDEDADVKLSGDLSEGAVGLLYANFDKLVLKFKEGKRKEQSEKDFLKDIMSDISHQLKTPLASLTVFMDLLAEDKVPEEEEKKKIILESQKQLTRMEWMVLSMLKLARIEAGAVRFEKKKTVLRPMLSQAVEAVKYLTDKRQQHIVVECDEVVEVLCDPKWTTEAIINLLKNASDYSGVGDNKEIKISVEANNIFTRVYIEDQGIGISEEDLPHVFKRFYRVSNNTNPDSVGIGLSLTKSIIDGQDGSIRVESKPGVGTKFIITL